MLSAAAARRKKNERFPFSFLLSRSLGRESPRCCCILRPSLAMTDAQPQERPLDWCETVITAFIGMRARPLCPSLDGTRIAKRENKPPLVEKTKSKTDISEGDVGFFCCAIACQYRKTLPCSDNDRLLLESDDANGR